jgi:two-component system, sensor histidine kinase and response regulator
VVTNLVGNAVKFTPDRPRANHRECESQDGEKAQIRVSVEDTGPGIPADKIGKLFQKFSQVDGSTTRKVGGTGLGLAISKQLVNLMGGEVGVTARWARLDFLVYAAICNSMRSRTPSRCRWPTCAACAC